MVRCWSSTEAGASLSGQLGFFGLGVLGSQLAAVDEVFELLLVLIRVAIGLVPEHSSLLDEVVKRRLGVAGGSEAELARGFRDGKGATPAQEVQQLRGQGGQSAASQAKYGQLQPDRREQRRVQLACGVQQL